MRVFIVFAFIITISCNTSDTSIPTEHQGIFTFSEDLLSNVSTSPPMDIEEAQILCRGKGLKVARCISDQLKKGHCLGIVKEGKDVFVVAIECHNLKASANQDTVPLSE